MIFPDEFSADDIYNFFKKSDIIYEIVSDTNFSYKQIMIRDPIDRKKLAILAGERNYVVYTLVDLKNGQVGYSKGIRHVNRINEGIYLIIRRQEN